MRVCRAGLKLFTVGRGDDLSGWAVRNLSVTVTETEFSNQFVVRTRLVQNLLLQPARLTLPLCASTVLP